MRVLRSFAVGVVSCGLPFLLLPLAVGCGGDTTKTGTLVEKAPGQETGEQASQDHMKAMMNKQAGKSN